MVGNVNSTQDLNQPTKTNAKTAKQCNTYHRHNLDHSTRHKKYIYESQKESKKTIPNASKLRKQHFLQRSSAHDI